MNKAIFFPTFFLIAIFFTACMTASGTGDKIVFDLNDYISGDSFNLSAPLQQSGSPRFSLENGELRLGNRSESWYAIDLMRDFDPSPLQPGDTVTIEGRIIDAPSGTAMVLGGAESPWNWIISTDVEGSQSYSLQTVLTEQHFSENQFVRLRLQTNETGANCDFTISKWIVTRTAGSAAPAVSAPRWDLTLPGLSELFSSYFRIGNVYSGSSMMSLFNTEEAYRHHFNGVTAENGHKPAGIAGPENRTVRPDAQEFNFTEADAIVDWAVENDMELFGHTLVWHSQTPRWLFSSSTGEPLTRKEALENMEFYISTLADHWSERGVIDRFYSWDVVNEALSNNGGSWGGPLDDWEAGDWRTQLRTESGWYRAFENGSDRAAGEHPSDFIFYAFYFARNYFPASVLYYNDYNEEIPAKRNAIGQMVDEINQRWKSHPEYDGRLLIEGIGLQSHYHLRGWTTDLDKVRAALERFAATGAEMSVTELDVTVGGYGAGVPAESELPALYEEQADAYARLFGYYLEFAEQIHRVSFWGLADSRSWRAPGHPLLFDRNFMAKPAFHGIVDKVMFFES